MDERTESQKLEDTAVRSEIGERAGAVLVIAPTVREAQDWAAEHEIPYSRTIPITPANFDQAMRGRTGVPHIIIRWHAFHDAARQPIRELLMTMQSPPWEDLDAGRVAEPAVVRSGGVG